MTSAVQLSTLNVQDKRSNDQLSLTTEHTEHTEGGANNRTLNVHLADRLELFAYR